MWCCVAASFEFSHLKPLTVTHSLTRSCYKDRKIQTERGGSCREKRESGVKQKRQREVKKTLEFAEKWK